MLTESRLKLAIVGTGISGLSAAWLLNQQHDVTVYERAERIGGHSNTILASLRGRRIPVDIGFIVYNRQTYPNLTALFELLGVPVQPSEMSFAASLDGGALEYSGSGLSGLFAQPRNLIRPRFWSMLRDLARFYRAASRDAAGLVDAELSLGSYLARGGYGTAFRDDHLLPMASAIWSASPAAMLSYPAATFLRFHHNHGLLRLRGRPEWQTVVGGAREYVERLTGSFAASIRLNAGVREIRRADRGVTIVASAGEPERYDHVVLACHADQALAALGDPTPAERNLLGAVRYSRNLAVLHTDESFMPKRRAAWSSWNYLGGRGDADDSVCVTYWINRLQRIDSRQPLFLTLNPPRPPRSGALLHSEIYEHPIFDAAAVAAQARLWSLQGHQNTWYCGSYFGYGFHEDGLQAGLAVAEQLGGVRRPWHVPNQSGRIVLAGNGAEAKMLELPA